MICCLKLLLVLSVVRGLANGLVLQRELQPQQQKQQPQRRQKVVVVGGGIGGLAVAARIAASSVCRQPGRPRRSSSSPGIDIAVLEKNPTIGGRCGSFFVDIPGYGIFRHERGPSLLLLPHIYERLFLDCGAGPAREYGLRMVPCNPAYQVIFCDGDKILVGFRRNKDKMSEEEHLSREKMDAFELNGSRKWDEYLQACQAFLNCGLPNFIEERLDIKSFPNFIMEAFRDFGKSWPLKPHSDMLQRLFDSAKMRALASFQDLYVGLEPYRNDGLPAGGIFDSTAPAVFGLLAAIELHPENKICGVSAPLGGFGSVSQAISNLCRDLGVSIQCNHTVTSVSPTGVTVQCTSSSSNTSFFLPADLVVVNADLPYAQRSLVIPTGEASERYDWEDKYKFSSGVIAFHWCINKTLDALHVHNVFLKAGSTDSDARDSWRCVREKKITVGSNRFDLEDACNFYVHRPTKIDSTAAPEGCDSVLVLLPCPVLVRQASCASIDRASAISHYSKQFDKETIESARSMVLKRLAVLKGLENLRDFIIHETVDTPATMADHWNVAAGTPFGLSHGLSQLSRLRPSSLPDEFPEAVFVGASCRPGNGVPLVLVGAEQAASLAINLLQKKSKL